MFLSSASNRTSHLPTNTIGTILSTAIERAVCEDRVVIGLNPVINFLKKNGARGAADGREVIFCVLVSTEEAVVHMQNTLLQAYCNENDIDFIRVDSAEKLTRLLQCPGTTETCVLVLSSENRSEGRPSILMTGPELALTHYCDEIWSSGRKHSITLPEPSLSGRTE